MAQHQARKRFGQHFLTDGAVIDQIVQAIAPQPGDAMVEIGPGLAAMTQPLVERLGRMHVIELDRDLAHRLREHAQLDVTQADVLKVDFTELAVTMQTGQLRVVGNLPYNISTPLLFHLLEHVAVVKDQAFDPPPRVDSAMVRMLPHTNGAAVDAKLLSELVQVAFSQRRKLLRHTLGRWLTERGFSGDFDVQRRAEEVPVQQYLALAQTLSEQA